MFLKSKEPRQTTYSKDGTGRDTYISFNNGGMLKNFQIVQGGYERGQFQKKCNTRQQVRPIRGKMQHYHTDGTGRDVYINCDAGGLCQSELFQKESFISNLRKYQRQRVHSLNQEQDDQIIKQQKQLINRLSVPKKTEDPYIHLRQCIRKRQI